MSPQYFIMYLVVLWCYVRLMRRWKRKRLSTGKGFGTLYPVVSVLGGIAMFYLGALAFLFSLFMTHNWYIFTDSRKAVIEEQYGITDGGGVRFTHYQVSFGGPDGSNYFLTLTCTGDVREMLETHGSGTITKYTLNGQVWCAEDDPDDPDAVPYMTIAPSDPYSEYYEYEHGRRYFVTVKDEGDQKRVTFRW